MYQLFTIPKGLILTPLVLALVFIMACGGTAAEPIVVEKEVIREVIKEIVVEKEVIKEVPVEVVVVKEVVKEVIKEVVVFEKAVQGGKIASAEVKPADAPKTVTGATSGGIINMAQYADVRQRLIHQSSVLNMNMAPLFNNLIEYNPETDFSTVSSAYSSASSLATSRLLKNPDTDRTDVMGRR